MNAFLFALVLQAAQGGAQWPAVAADGRIAFETSGDLFVARASGAPVRVTSGPAIDRQPVWSADGRSLVFVSDRSGNTDLWRVTINESRAATAPERLTTAPEPDFDPAIAADGSIVFARGTYDATDIYVRAPDGAERKLVSAQGADRSPTVARDGTVAYVATRDGRRQLRSISLDGRNDRAVLADAAVEFPAWSPAGDRIVYTTTGTRGSVMITNREGAYTNVVSRRRGRATWLASGDSLLIAELPADGVGYNGDPDRLLDRDAERDALFEGALWRVAVPDAPDAGRADVVFSVPLSDSMKLDLFERAARLVAATYFSKPEQANARAAWERSANELRAKARQANSRAELDAVVHELMLKRPPLRIEASGRAGASSAHPLATDAGLEMLRKGGNVVDAAVAISFALGVVEPDASGVGGYGQMLIQMQGMEQPVLIEFMSRAPEEATLSNSALNDPNLPGAALANVPGTVDGMWRAWQRYGSKKLKWAELLEPAIKLAEQGYVLDDAFPTTLRREQVQYLKNESTRTLFFRNGKPLAPGDTLRNPDLAWTLKQIAQGGADAFYRGEIARRMVADLRSKGNAMNTRDLARYYAEWREPVSTTYRGHTVFSSAPPASGGALLAGQLNLLENFANPKAPTEDAASAHAFIEAWKLTPRSRIADPGLWPVDISASLSKDTARARWGCFFSPGRATRASDLQPRGDSAGGRRCPNAAADASNSRDEESESGECDVSNHDRACRSTGTTAFAVADADGNMVATTQTLGTWGGNFYVTPGLGFIYNDKLRSYGNAPDAYGARLPNARHGSSLAPTLVFKGVGPARKPLLAVGAAGNAWINSAVYSVVTGVIDHGMGPQQALEQPRILPGSRTGANGETESVIDMESGFSPAVLKQLEALGHRFNLVSLPGEVREGYGAAVLVESGRIRAGGDPRRSGAGGAVK
jgi:gamma-glutamyltranspeptidase